MKKILFVLFCFVALIGCNNELSAPSCDNYKNYSSKDSLCILKDWSPTQDFTYDTERLYDGEMIDKSGYVSICGENGTLVTLVYYKNGKRDRLMRRWHQENGNLGYECTYVNGKKDGFEGVWDVNGQPQEENHYKNGIWDYPRKRWYVNGQLKSVEYEPKQTISQHLLREEWYENGQLKQAFYNIRTRKWSEDGTLIHEGTLMEGGKWVKTLWYENGQLKQVSPEMKSNEEIAVKPLAKDAPAEEDAPAEGDAAETVGSAVEVVKLSLKEENSACYIRKLYELNNIFYIDVDFINIETVKDGDYEYSQIVNNNPKIRTYCLGTETDANLTEQEIKMYINEDKESLFIVSAKNGYIVTLNEFSLPG